MLILGPGGTGKSKLIRAVTETFSHYGKETTLAKCATTGVAAIEIGGTTVHSWACLMRSIPKGDDWIEKTTKATSEKRLTNTKDKDFIIIDEISMADKAMLYCVSEIVASAKGREGKGSAEEPFGGANIILTGDFHQFPPVTNASGALYVDRTEDSKRAKIGREIFKQFDTVVILEDQKRATDKRWIEILNNLRVGQCNFNDLDEIHKLVLTDPNCIQPDFQAQPWNDAILITPRHAVREAWNEQAVIKHCQTSGNLRYVVPAYDVHVDKKMVKELPMEARLAVAKANPSETGKLPDRVDIAIGMKAMVVLNLATEADIANGTRGVIDSIVMDEREGLHPESVNGTVILQYAPVMVLFRPDRETRITFPGIEAGLIPITPSESRFTVQGESGKKYRVSRQQYAMTPAYSFTDYKSQGQTIEYVIIDIGKPPTGALSPFSIYVALSRSRGRDTIRLLRDFDEALFQHHPSEALRLDMERIKGLNVLTKKKWEEERKR